MPHPGELSISDYTYDLPDERIALQPLAIRDHSKLLVFENHRIQQTIFRELPTHLPEKALLVFNESKVIRARIRFQKSTGSFIEVFCLEPAGSFTDFAIALNEKGSSAWYCMVGGLSKWKEPSLVSVIQTNNRSIQLTAVIEQRLSDCHLIRFTWDAPDVCMGDILEWAGDMPLPPYIKRSTTNTDADRYQTIYAKSEGSVAAPTAGLHFTDRVLESLNRKGIQRSAVVLHVGAGTFRPVKAKSMQDHDMHAEWIDVSINTIRQWKVHEGPMIATGTTSLRTMETLYWLGVRCAIDPATTDFTITQWHVYEAPFSETNLTRREALEALEHRMTELNIDRIFTQTSLLIMPGYRFRMTDALITNFHQPQSTLLLLVAAAIGEEWRTVYDYALKYDFRFLSYGDASLIYID
ncbi:MAG: S-adenosylmethionine:tRNA ribosyltransferase-isomerase [Ferruginibacter sp.]